VAPIAAQPTLAPSPTPTPTPVAPPAPTPTVVPVPTPTLAPPRPTPVAVCVDTASLVPLLNAAGEQVRDQATGLASWLVAGDDSGKLVLGPACEVPPAVPLGVPATGDGSAPLDDDNYMSMP